MFNAVWGFIFSRIPPKVWLIIFCVLITLGAFFWFKHSIYQSGKTEAKAECVAQKNEDLTDTIINSQNSKKDREKTDNEVYKMPLNDVDRGLLSNGWLRPY